VPYMLKVGLTAQLHGLLPKQARSGHAEIGTHAVSGGVQFDGKLNGQAD
jgi:hypothetical protein